MGKLFIVSTGPGSLSHITPRAREAISSSDLVVGYKTYIDLIRPLLSGKETLATGMGRELERATKAIEEAAGGRTVSLVSSGDAGIYGMAGLVFELCRARGIRLAPGDRDGLEVEVIPGVPALCAAASLLGAPLMHDFASISLSDLLTPISLILKRIEAAASADFIIVLYNPRSKKRVTQLEDAVEIIMKYRRPETPAGIVKRAMREDERIIVTTLSELPVSDIDMQTTVIVGNSNTFAHEGLMVTPRGYLDKYEA